MFLIRSFFILVLIISSSFANASLVTEDELAGLPQDRTPLAPLGVGAELKRQSDIQKNRGAKDARVLLRKITPEDRKKVYLPPIESADVTLVAPSPAARTHGDSKMRIEIVESSVDSRAASSASKVSRKQNRKYLSVPTHSYAKRKHKGKNRRSKRRQLTPTKTPAAPFRSREPRVEEVLLPDGSLQTRVISGVEKVGDLIVNILPSDNTR